MELSDTYILRHFDLLSPFIILCLMKKKRLYLDHMSFKSRSLERKGRPLKFLINLRFAHIFVIVTTRDWSPKSER